MNDETIVLMYNEAQDKEKQIKSLAKMNKCSCKLITQILNKNGIPAAKISGGRKASKKAEEPKKEIKQRVTYEIDSKENFSPIPPLKKNQSMLYQNISPVIPLKKTNSLFNIREKNYNENKINVKETPKNLMSNSQNM